MNHLELLKIKMANARSLADVFEFLKELQGVDGVWERIQGHLQEDIACAAETDAALATTVLEDVKAVRTSLSEMEKEVSGWQLAGPNQKNPATKAEKQRIPTPRTG